MQKILTFAILLTVGAFGTSSISAQINPTQIHFASSSENNFLNEQTDRWRRNQPNRINRNQNRWNRNQQKRWNRNQQNRWNRNQNRWNRNQQNRWNRNQNRYRYNPSMQRGMRTVNRTHIIRRGGQNYRQTTQYRYLPNGRTQTRVLNLVRIF